MHTKKAGKEIKPRTSSPSHKITSSKSRLKLPTFFGLEYAMMSHKIDFFKGLKKQGVLFVDQLPGAPDHAFDRREKADGMPCSSPGHHHPVYRTVQSPIGPSLYVAES
ncbi:hypothetical protein NL676_033302 [Syzygium grande]|nr:hypothetical protein NL676_033302 [Syzygium grande]